MSALQVAQSVYTRTVILLAYGSSIRIQHSGPVRIVPEPEDKRDFYAPFRWNSHLQRVWLCALSRSRSTSQVQENCSISTSTLYTFPVRDTTRRLLTHITCLDIPPLSPHILETPIPFSTITTPNARSYRFSRAFVLNYATQAPTFRSHANANEI